MPSSPAASRSAGRKRPLISATDTRGACTLTLIAADDAVAEILDGHRDRAQSDLELLIDERVLPVADARRPPRRARSSVDDRAMRERHELDAAQVGGEIRSDQAGEQHAAHRRAVRGQAAADAEVDRQRSACPTDDRAM